MSEISHTITLKVPVKLLLKGPSGAETEQEIGSLTFKDRAVAGDYLCMDNVEGRLHRLNAFAAQMTGQPVRVIEKLDADSGDYAAVIKRAADFLKPIQEIAAYL